MLGIVAGDIIASPYQWADAPDRYFVMGESTRVYRGGREVNVHPHFTDGTVLSLAVARWIMQDESRSPYKLSAMIRDFGRDYPNCGMSPRMQRFVESDSPRPFSGDESAVAMMAVPVGLRASSLPEAISMPDWWLRLCQQANSVPRLHKQSPRSYGWHVTQGRRRTYASPSRRTSVMTCR